VRTASVSIVLAGALVLLPLTQSCKDARSSAKVRCRTAAPSIDAAVGVCLDRATFFTCEGGVEIPCRGAKGCVGGEHPSRFHEACDVSRDLDGDPCVASNRHHGQCAADGKSLVDCMLAIGRPQRFAVIPCRGPRGCVDEGKDEPTCDESLAVVGEACHDSGACSADHAVLTCDDLGFGNPGRWTVQQLCRGPGGCERIPAEDGNGYSIACDNDIAVEGDPCTFDGLSACNAEGTAELTCKDHRMTFDTHCKCTVERTDKHTSSITCSGG
jgi:hypothetical protein